ncbi:DUF2252 family protein [uncultured Pseudokineococcus sp.]|uniref:DUF2252 domain-containing protein n=1 Tax=uncultured Pseudokineococcus sp. TaxID=1642928 RepID=UPI00260B88FF|nr:DUF2252 family protein [uncultured Pseudokineococcus sp.]
MPSDARPAHPSYRSDASTPGPPDDERGETIVRVLDDAFAPMMESSPAGFRTRFRKMARDPFAFYRGSAALFYDDLAHLSAGVDDDWVDEGTSRIWLQGDLHAENFGTHLDADGRLVFDVNDFDEAYLGHWTWDLRRFTASLALLSWQKALPDEAIDDLVGGYVRAYLDQVDRYRTSPEADRWALTLDNADGPVLRSLQSAKLASRHRFLDARTTVEDHRRRFTERSGVRLLDDEERERVVEAFGAYRETLREGLRGHRPTLEVLDVVGRSGFGIGSAGLPAYTVLVEGRSQAVDDDLLLSVKQGDVACPSRVVEDERVARAFEHHCHRTALSQRALQTDAAPLVGWTRLPGTGDRVHGFVVTEVSPHEADLDWDDVDEPDEMRGLVDALGRATAKIHCAGGGDPAGELVGVVVEDEVSRVVDGRVDALVDHLVDWAHACSARTRADHRLFVDAFRSGAWERVAPTS